MRPVFLLRATFAIVVAAALLSCKDFGKKVKIIGTRGEVYYKNGATEDDARKVGDFLKEGGLFNTEKAASVQVVKENGEYTVRFVYDKNYYENNKSVEDEFKQYAVKLSEGVFDGKNVNITLADNAFKDFKLIPFDKTLVKKKEDKPENPDAPPGEPLSKNEFDHDKQGDVTYYWKGISDKESKAIADYITQTGEFEGGHSEIYMIKQGDRYILKFPVKQEYRNDPATIDQIGKISKKIKDNVFPDNAYSFEMTDEQLNAVKTFDY